MDALFQKFLQEMICTWILFPFLAKIRPECRGRFWSFVVVWSAFSWLDTAYLLHVRWYGIDVYHLVWVLLVLIYLLIIGSYVEGGWVRVTYAIIIQDLALSLVSIGLMWAMSRLKGVPFQTLYNDMQAAYTPGYILANYVTYFLVFFPLRRFLQFFREAPLEHSRISKLFALGYLIFAISPAVRKLSTAGYGTRNLWNFVPYILFSAVGFLLLLYHMRSDSLRRQNALLVRQQHLMREHMKMSEEQFQLTRKLRHDIKRHLRTLEWAGEASVSDDGMISADRKELATRREHYRDQLKQMYDSLGAGNYGSEFGGDAMLFSLERYCKEYGIPCRISLRNLDLTGFSEQQCTDLMFDLSYWLIQSCQYWLQQEPEVQIAGAQAAGRNQITAICRHAQTGGREEHRTGRRQHLSALKYQERDIRKRLERFGEAEILELSREEAGQKATGVRESGRETAGRMIRVSCFTGNP